MEKYKSFFKAYLSKRETFGNPVYALLFYSLRFKLFAFLGKNVLE